MYARKSKALAGVGLAVVGLAAGWVVGRWQSPAGPPPEAMPSLVTDHLARLDPANPGPFIADAVNPDGTVRGHLLVRAVVRPEQPLTAPLGARAVLRVTGADGPVLVGTVVPASPAYLMPHAE
jgi:hypothetical protein